MKITKSKLKQVIKEELAKALNEDYSQLMQTIRDKFANGQEVDRETCDEINNQFVQLTGDPLAGPCTYTKRGGALELD